MEILNGRKVAEEIKAEIDTLIATLIKKKIKPAVVTICRSCDSGYCPAEKAELIEPLLISELESLIS